MYTIQPNYGGMLAAYVDEISAAQDEESRQQKSRAWRQGLVWVCGWRGFDGQKKSPPARAGGGLCCKRSGVAG